mgnify:FL=1
MRFSPIFTRFVYTLSNFTRIRTARNLQLQTLRPLPLRSMSGIPFLGALFGSSSNSSSKMSYPDQRSNDEWRAVLNKGTFAPRVHIDEIATNFEPQSSFAS